MKATPATAAAPVTPAPGPAMPIYWAEALASIGGTLFTIGIFFYTTHVLGWGLAGNFRLAAVQGCVYVVGALLAQQLTARLPHRAAMAWLNGLMMAVALGGLVSLRASGSASLAATVLAYTFVSAIAWPILESWISTGVDAPTLAKRLSTYNVIWPAVGAGTMAASGAVIKFWTPGVFIVPAACHAVIVVILLTAGRRAKTPAPDAVAPATGDTPRATPILDYGPAPDLLRLRTMALLVSRLALPATYAVIYGLMPIMPSLPAVKQLDARAQTVVGGAWLVARWLTFAVLAASTWWHTRPRVLLWAAVLMLVAFFGVALPPSAVWGPAATPAIDLAAILTWQALLGVALGVIYSGSLYFGMVLGGGSTEHSGYHEALIGLGWVLGPAAGAAAQWLRPDDPKLGVGAVGAVIALSVMAVAGTSLVLGRRSAAAR